MFLNKYINKIKLSLILIQQGCLLKCISTSRPNWSWDFSLPLQCVRKTTGNGTHCPWAVLRKLAAVLGPSAGVFPQEPRFSHACVKSRQTLFVSSLNIFFPDSYECSTSDTFHPQTVLCSYLLIMTGNSNNLSDNLPLCKGVSLEKKIFWTGHFYWLKRSLFLEVIFTVGVIILF